jgi:hypothetical protein
MTDEKKDEEILRFKTTKKWTVLHEDLLFEEWLDKKASRRAVYC